MERIKRFLADRKENGLLRELYPASLRREGRICIKGKAYWDFSSNDYLGLSSAPQLLEAAKAALEQFGTSASASRLMSGDTELCHCLEEKVARFKNKESALVFNSGYQANIGIISALCRKGDAVFCDRLSHASIIDGVLLSGARFFRFAHNDLDHLGDLLKKHRAKFDQGVIVTETIFSMDGDKAPLAGLVRLKEEYNCRLLVDEAHATGVFGARGSGVVGEEGLSGKVDWIMGTFSKALGSFGAYLAADAATIDYLINSARGFIYSTALPPAVIAVNLCSLDLVEREAFRRKQLLENAAYFRNRLKEQGIPVTGSSQIVPLICGDTATALSLSRGLQGEGYWVLPVRPPTVPRGEARLRFSLTYYHNREILDRLIAEIKGKGVTPIFVV